MNDDTDKKPRYYRCTYNRSYAVGYVDERGSFVITAGSTWSAARPSLDSLSLKYRKLIAPDDADCKNRFTMTSDFTCKDADVAARIIAGCLCDEYVWISADGDHPYVYRTEMQELFIHDDCGAVPDIVEPDRVASSPEDFLRIAEELLAEFDSISLSSINGVTYGLAAEKNGVTVFDCVDVDNYRQEWFPDVGSALVDFMINGRPLLDFISGIGIYIPKIVG